MRAYTHLLLAVMLVIGAVACDDSSGTTTGDEDSGGGGTVADGGAMDLGTEGDLGGGGGMIDPDMAEPADAATDGAVPDGAVEDTLCQTCESDDDCEGAEARCIEVGGEMVCGAACADDDGCPDDYECAELEDGDQCVPVTGSCGDCEDVDGDGYGVGPGCLGADCDEESVDNHEGADDPCDGVDNDCDMEVDEDFAAEMCGVGACAATSSCEGGVETACEPGVPAENDATCDGTDDDCDDSIDEDYEAVACGAGACAATSVCEDGVETECAPLDIAAPNDDTCDGADEDCDGEVDEDYVGEECGVGACAAAGSCEAGEVMCVVNDPIAIDDASCDGVDDDCDGETDEDYDGAGEGAACGFGVCRREASCVDGEIGCEPGEPEAMIDDSCDGVDQDCDGRVDDECNANALGFAVAEQGADFINVDVTYQQEAPPDDENVQSRPRLVTLRVLYPPELTLTVDGEPAIVRGPPVVAAQKQLQVFEPAPGELRIIIISADNSNRIGAGTLVTMRFQKNGEDAPYAFAWDEARTTFAPEPANDILTMEGAQLE